MLYQFEVTQEDIDHGIRYSCRECPIARVINRTFSKEILVDGANLSVPFCADIVGIIEYKLFELPQEVKNSIRDFDKQLKVEPFTFEMELPF